MRCRAALIRAAALTAAMLMAMSAAHAQQGEDLRAAAQNPVGDLISVPFQNNTNFDIGRSENTQTFSTFNRFIHSTSIRIGT
jgi:hypothetical protein